MDWLTAALLSILIGVFLAVIDKYMVGKININAYILLIGSFGLFTLLLFPIANVEPLSLLEWSIGLVLGIVLCFIIYATFRAFQKEEVSRLVPLGILSTVFISIGAAVFFGERLSTQQLIAFVLFTVGAVTLSIRVDKKMVLLYDLTNFRIDRVGRTLTKETQRIVYNPLRAGKQLHKEMMRNAKSTYGLWREIYGHLVTYIPWDTGLIERKTRLKAIRGLWWYLLVITLAIPFTLLVKEYNTTIGVMRGFIAVRVGLFVGSLLLALGHWNDIVHFLKQTKLFAIASVKEIFGLTAAYLGYFAAATGPLAIVQSMGALSSVGVFIVATILTKLGILNESLKKRDLIQKVFGILCIAIATVLLFV